VQLAAVSLAQLYRKWLIAGGGNGNQKMAKMAWRIIRQYHRAKLISLMALAPKLSALA